VDGDSHVGTQSARDARGAARDGHVPGVFTLWMVGDQLPIRSGKGRPKRSRSSSALRNRTEIHPGDF
jgi:hypothetical protein